MWVMTSRMRDPIVALLAQWITFVSLFAPAKKGSIRILEGLLPLVIPEGEIITLERVNIISWRDRAGLFQGLVGDHREQRFLGQGRSEEHTSELQSLMRISYAVFCLKHKKYDQVIKSHC